jgi:hypothetical protein
MREVQAKNSKANLQLIEAYVGSTSAPLLRGLFVRPLYRSLDVIM